MLAHGVKEEGVEHKEGEVREKPLEKCLHRQERALKSCFAKQDKRNLLVVLAHCSSLAVVVEWVHVAQTLPPVWRFVVAQAR